MRKFSIPVLTGTLVAAALLTAAPSPAFAGAPQLFWAQGYGTGATAAAAETAADKNLVEYGEGSANCGPAILVSDTESSGVWASFVKARCLVDNE